MRIVTLNNFNLKQNQNYFNKSFGANSTAIKDLSDTRYIANAILKARIIQDAMDAGDESTMFTEVQSILTRSDDYKLHPYPADAM